MGSSVLKEFCKKDNVLNRKYPDPVAFLKAKSLEMIRFPDGTLSDHYGRATEHNDTTVHCGISDSGRHQVSDQDRGRAHGDRIGWSDTRAHISCARGRLTANKYGRATGG